MSETYEEWPTTARFIARFKLELNPEQSAELWSTLAKLGGPRACRICDYGDDPACDHEQRAKRVCQAPVGDFDCAIVPCLGACATPKRVTVSDWEDA